MGTSVTVKDIAQQANVSVGTVSRVFNNHLNVSEEVRRRVLKVAHDLGYTGSSGLRGAIPQINKPLNEIGFIFSPVNEGTTPAGNLFWSNILNGVEQESSRENIKLTYRSIGHLSNTPRLIQSFINEMGLDGVLLVGPVDPGVLEAIQSANLPFVLVAHSLSTFTVDAVVENNFEGTYQAIEYLIGKNHRRIAFIGGPGGLVNNHPVNNLYSLERRLHGYRAALLNAGIPIDYDLYEASNLSPEGGYQACKRLLDRGTDFSALFCSNDDTAIGAIRALTEKGLKIPEDISIISFGDYLHSAQQLVPALTSVHVNFTDMGRIAVQRLIARASDPSMPTVTTMLNFELKLRSSVTEFNPNR